MTGNVIGDATPPSHITSAPRPASPPAPAAAPAAVPAEQNGVADSRATHRQSVDWYAGLADDPGQVSPMPAMLEEEEPAPAPVPAIQVDSAPADEGPDPMEDVDTSIRKSICC